MKLRCIKEASKVDYTNREGITLIALVITIVILLILARVSISMVAGEGGIVQQATGAKEEQLLAEEKEGIQMAVGGAQIEKLGTLEKNSLDAQLELRFGAGKYTLVEETDKFKITITETENLYEIDKNGKVNSYKGITLNKDNINLKIEAGIYPTEELIVTQYQVDGDITWEISDSSIATLSDTIGNKVTVTAVNSGETTVTVTSGEYSKTCKITIDKGMMLGNYVKYNISYKDAIKTTLSYDSTNGWRYLGKDTITGEHLLISAGIPAKFTYSSTEQSWWGSATDENGNQKQANVRIAEGLRDNLEMVSFTGTVNGNTTGITGSTFIIEKATDVTILEVSSGTSGVKLPTGYRNLTGEASDLFNLYNLNSKYATDVGNVYWWLASPKDLSYRKGKCLYVVYKDGGLDYFDSGSLGIRPVIKFPAETIFELTDEGYYEIK